MYGFRAEPMWQVVGKRYGACRNLQCALSTVLHDYGYTWAEICNVGMCVMQAGLNCYLQFSFYITFIYYMDK